MNNHKRKSIGSYILAGIMLCALLGMIYFGCQKNGYHIDEVYSYGLANSEYLPFMHFGEQDYAVKDWMLEYGAGESLGQLVGNLKKDYDILKEYDFDFYQTPIYQAYRVAQANSADTTTTTWVSGQDYLHYIAVSPQNSFNYASVYYNQRGDVHPPLFYMLLHTICSVFQGRFSKWYGLVINMVFLLLTLWMLYRMCREFVGGEKVALAIVAVYAFSQGFMSTAMFIRMYAMLTFWVVWSCYLHLRLVKADFQMTKKRVFSLMLVTFLGFYTHYYYVLYAIGIAMVCAVLMAVKKKYRNLFQYILTLGTTAVLGICIWLFAIKHVFYGYRGQGSFQALKQIEYYFLKLKLIAAQIFSPMLGGKWWLLVVVLLLTLTAMILVKGQGVKAGNICMIVLPILFYTVMVSQIVPFYADRYVMCTYPFVCMILIGGIGYLVKCLCGGSLTVVSEKLQNSLKKYRGRVETIVLLTAVGILFVCNNYFWHMPGYLCPEGQETATVLENTDCVYVLPDGDWNESAEESTVLAQCKRVGIVYESNISVLSEEYEYQEGDNLMICVHNQMDVDDVIRKVQESLGAESLREISRENGTNVVRVTFTK